MMKILLIAIALVAFGTIGYFAFVFFVTPVFISLTAPRIVFNVPENYSGLIVVRRDSDGIEIGKSKRAYQIYVSDNGIIKVANFNIFRGAMKLSARTSKGEKLGVASLGEVSDGERRLWTMNVPLKEESYFFVGTETEYLSFMKAKGKDIYTFDKKDED